MFSASDPFACQPDAAFRRVDGSPRDRIGVRNPVGVGLRAISRFPWRQLVTLFCLVMLIGQMLAATQQRPASATPLFAQELFGDRIVICTSAGLVVLDRRTGQPASADDRTDGDGSSGEHATAFCLFCLPTLHGDTHAPTPVGLPVPQVRSVGRKIRISHAIAPTATSWGDAWPRAPPSS